jgi:hypothetical protein
MLCGRKANVYVNKVNLRFLNFRNGLPIIRVRVRVKVKVRVRVRVRVRVQVRVRIQGSWFRVQG